MVCDVVSNVGNRYEIAEEDSFGDGAASPTILDFGHIQTISVDEDESTEEVSSMNSGHTAFGFEDGLYNVSGQIVTKLTKASIPVILKAAFGEIATVTDDYEATTNPVCSEDLSYFMKFNTQSGKIMEMDGICFTAAEFAVEKGGSVVATLTYQAQILTPATEALSPSTTVGAIFMGLDASITYDGNETILDSFTFSIDWNYDSADSRGIEVASSNGRRVIKRILRNNLTIAGNFESKMDGNIDTGYLDERTGKTIILNLSRGTDNEHVITIVSSKTNTRSRELNNDNSTKTIVCDFQATNVSATGDY